MGGRYFNGWLIAFLISWTICTPSPVWASEAKSASKAKTEHSSERQFDASPTLQSEVESLQTEVGSLRAEVAALSETEASNASPMNDAMTTMRIAMVIMGLGLGVALFEIRRLKKGLIAPQKNNA